MNNRTDLDSHVDTMALDKIIAMQKEEIIQLRNIIKKSRESLISCSNRSSRLSELLQDTSAQLDSISHKLRTQE